MDDARQGGGTEHHEHLGQGEKRPDAPGEMWKQPAGVDDHIRIQRCECLGDCRPGGFVGHRLVGTGQAVEDGQTRGQGGGVLPHSVRLQSTATGSEEGPKTGRRGNTEPSRQIATEWVRLDEEDTLVLRPGGSEGGGRRRDPGRTFDRSDKDHHGA